jgi:tetratricopeptide (TPR) repeat protein
MNHNFICHSSLADEFAIRLADALEAGPPPFPVWLDKRDIKPAGDWDTQIAGAISACNVLLFLMDSDSVDDTSVCKVEWTRALKYKKPIVPIMLDAKVEAPFRLANRQYIDFSSNFDQGLAQLRNYFQWLASPEGAVQALKYRLADADRDLRRATDPMEKARIQEEKEQLKRDIATQEAIIANPQAAQARVQESVARGIERERPEEKPVSAPQHTKFINPPPAVAPSYFQNRQVETQIVGDFLKDDALRLMMVVGRGGIGKTAIVCRLLKALEGGQLPDDGGPMAVDGIVYLSATGSHRISMYNLYSDLSKLLLTDTAAQLDALYKNPHADTEAKMRALLEAFPTGRTVLLLDNFEDLVDPQTLDIAGQELRDALYALLNSPHHAVKVIITTRIAPRNLALVQPGLQTRLDLDEGLPSPYAENILRAMDKDGKVGFRNAPDRLLGEARERTRGYPRALEALFAILSADRYTTLQEALNDTAKLLPGNVVEALVGEAFNRLDSGAQQVMQALAVYASPVAPAAVDYLLQPHVPGVDSATVLNRLVNMQFVRRERGRFYLHPVDQAYAFGRVPKGNKGDRFKKSKTSFTQFALLHRAADYFKRSRTPRENWKTIEDLEPQLAEFELRYRGEDYDTSAQILRDITHDYLFRWGFYRTMAELHERLEGKIDNPTLKYVSTSYLGIAYRMMGHYQRALTCYNQALMGARDQDDLKQQSASLGSMGNCYSNMGQTKRGIEYFEQALTISRQINDRIGEAILLDSLGNLFGELGQIDRAIVNHMQALAISRQISYQIGEGSCVGNLAEVLIDNARYEDASTHAWESLQIGHELNNPTIISWAGGTLALSRLFTNDLLGARTAAEAARQYDEPEHNHYVLALLGLIALRQGDNQAAQEAFGAAIAQANEMVKYSELNFKALDSKGLALCGLALCGDSSQLPTAIEAYRAARAINKDAGAVMRVLRLFDALAIADTTNVLAGVRAVAAGV